MTSRERVLAALNHRQPDRVPIDFSGHRSSGIAAIAYAKLKKELEITTGGVYIYDKNGNEIMSWMEDEWKEDVTSVVATCNAINVFYTEGEEALQKICGRKFSS